APETWMGHSGAVTALAFSPDGQAFVSGGADHLITMWDSNQHLDRGVFRGHQGPVWALAWSPDGKTLVSGSEDQTIRIWTPEDRQETGRLNLSAPVFSVDISSDRLWLTGSNGDKAV
ncbi:MAG TPA: serine/threonine protein kinase, partial [Candidatus Latescibacteria bacterium]|nr:serine/threonine protein kinase [Candidatus Latescibacterota bacterium]